MFKIMAIFLSDWKLAIGIVVGQFSLFFFFFQHCLPQLGCWSVLFLFVTNPSILQNRVLSCLLSSFLWPHSRALRDPYFDNHWSE